MSSLKLITVAFAALFLLAVSAVLHYAELYVMSATLVSVPVISYMLGRIAIRGLRCSREAPEYVREGELLRIQLRLHGKSNLLGPMEINDRLPEWIEKQTDEQSTTAEDSPEGVVLTYQATAKKRGEYTLGPLRLRISDPLGFFLFNCDYGITSRLIVLPRPLEIPELYMRPAGSFGEYQFEGTGARGSGTDFHGVREYQQGDELRRVHWPSTARHGRLNVIEFEHGKSPDAVIVIDLRRGSEIGTGRYTSLEYAVKIAAGLAEQTLKLGSAVRLACAGCEGPATVPGTGTDHMYVLLEALAKVQANRRETLSDVLLSELDSIAHNSVVMLFASSVDDDLPVCARLLASRGAKVQLVLINLAADLPRKTEQLAWRVAAEGVSLAVVDCSPEVASGYLRCNYAA